MTPTRGVIVVLGSPNDAQGCLSSIALEHCEQALSEYRRNPKCRILPTGGWGRHFNTTDKPHGHYVRKELARRGIPDAAFLQCAESSNTVEDATLSRPILASHPGADLIVVTSDFHEARARFLFEREFPDRKITLSTSVTKLPAEELARRRAHEAKALDRLKNQSTTKPLNATSETAPNAAPEAVQG